VIVLVWKGINALFLDIEEHHGLFVGILPVQHGDETPLLMEHV
jgi:hypothetical protein